MSNKKKSCSGSFGTIIMRDLQGKSVAIWGASFKENTSSIQQSPIHQMLAALWAQGVTVYLHDPQALDEIKLMYGQRDDLILCKDQYVAIQDMAYVF